MSKFYDDEIQRLKTALKDCEKIVIIGWSASGTDKFYQDIFNDVFKDNTHSISLYLINKQDPKLQENLQALFGKNTILHDIQMCGFNEKAVDKLDRIKIWGEDDGSCL